MRRDGPGVVIALAGRRIDAAGAVPRRFPSENVPRVAERLRTLFEREYATTLVSSAACGADLVAQTVAGTRGMRRRVVLPFDRARFKVTSVTDRGGAWEDVGEWGTVYDALLEALDRTGDVITLDAPREDAAAYIAASSRVLREAIALAPAGTAVATLVWEGASRGDDDITARLGAEAARLGLPVEHVSTL